MESVSLSIKDLYESYYYKSFPPFQIKLADKQAALEKIQWEAMTSGTKVEKLQEELNLMRGEISSFMMVFEGLMKTNTTVYAEDYDVLPCNLDHLPPIVSS